MTLRVWEFGSSFADEIYGFTTDSWKEAARSYMAATGNLGSATLVVEAEDGSQREVTVDCDDISYSVHLEKTGHVEERPTTERPQPPSYRVISVDGQQSDGPDGDDVVIASGIRSQRDAAVMAAALDSAREVGARRSFKIVDHTYKLKEFQP